MFLIFLSIYTCACILCKSLILFVRNLQRPPFSHLQHIPRHTHQPGAVVRQPRMQHDVLRRPCTRNVSNRNDSHDKHQQSQRDLGRVVQGWTASHLHGGSQEQHQKGRVIKLKKWSEWVDRWYGATERDFKEYPSAYFALWQARTPEIDMVAASSTAGGHCWGGGI